MNRALQQTRRPLGDVPIETERLYIASNLISEVSNVLADFANWSVPLEFFELLELVGKLNIVVDVIRTACGASG
jgi:hypothetical protein